MTKIIVANAVEFIGAQAAILIAGTIAAYAGHEMFGWTAESAASAIVMAQVAFAGFAIRGWLC